MTATVMTGQTMLLKIEVAAEASEKTVRTIYRWIEKGVVNQPKEGWVDFPTNRILHWDVIQNVSGSQTGQDRQRQLFQTRQLSPMPSVMPQGSAHPDNTTELVKAIQDRMEGHIEALQTAVESTQETLRAKDDQIMSLKEKMVEMEKRHQAQMEQLNYELANRNTQIQKYKSDEEWRQEVKQSIEEIKQTKKKGWWKPW